MIHPFKNKYFNYFKTGLGCLAAYQTADLGLAWFLGLDVLTHGTSPTGYIGISLNGANPFHGGGSFGACAAYGDLFAHSKPYQKDVKDVKDVQENLYKNSQGFFHVYPDGFRIARIAKENFETDSLPFFVYPPFSCIIPPIACKSYSVLSTKSNSKIAYKMLTGKDLNSNNAPSNPFFILSPPFFILSPPLLHFKFTPKSVTIQPLKCNPNKQTHPARFELDLDSPGALKTQFPIEASRLGITGSLRYGLDRDTPKRMQESPQKVLSGAALLGVSCYIGKQTLKQNKTSTPFKELSFKAKTIRIIKAPFWMSAACIAIML